MIFCIYVYIYMHIYIHMYIYIHIHLYAYIDIHVYIYLHIYIYIHTYIYIYMIIYVYIYIYLHICDYLCIWYNYYIHLHTHTRILYSSRLLANADRCAIAHLMRSPKSDPTTPPGIRQALRCVEGISTPWRSFSFPGSIWFKMMIILIDGSISQKSQIYSNLSHEFRLLFLENLE